MLEFVIEVGGKVLLVVLVPLLLFLQLLFLRFQLSFLLSHFLLSIDFLCLLLNKIDLIKDFLNLLFLQVAIFYQPLIVHHFVEVFHLLRIDLSFSLNKSIDRTHVILLVLTCVQNKRIQHPVLLRVVLFVDGILLPAPIALLLF